MENRNYSKVLSNISYAKRGSPLYLSEKDRFKGSFAEEERRRRLLHSSRKDECLEERRRRTVEMLERRKLNELEKQRKWDEKQRYLQQKGSPKNLSSVPYNTLTLEYNDSEAGKDLKFKDDKIRYRALLRSQRLYVEQNRNGYNPVTGEEKPQPVAPPSPKRE